MAVYLNAPATCRSCGQTMPKGERAKKCYGGYRHQRRCPAPVTATGEPLATERQVAYLLDLQMRYWTPAVFGGRRYDRASAAALTRDDASRCIEMLLDESRA